MKEAAAVRGETEAPGTPYMEGVMQRRDTQTPADTKLGKRSCVHHVAREAASDLQGKKKQKKQESRAPARPSCPLLYCLSAAGPDNDRMAARNVSRQGRQTGRDTHCRSQTRSLCWQQSERLQMNNAGITEDFKGPSS